jgi:hypothetical protein
MSRWGWVLALGGLACKDKDGEETGTPADTFVSGLEVTSTEVATVGRVQFTTEADATAWLEFNVDGTCAGLRTPDTTGTSHSALVLGVPASAEACGVAVAVDADGVEHRSAPWTFEAGPPPQGTAIPSVTVNDPTGYTEPYILAAMIREPPQHWIIDRQGQLVWGNLLDPSRQTVDIQPAGDGFSFCDYAADHSIDDSYVRYLGMDGAITADVRTELAHHAYFELADGSIGFLAIDVRPMDGFDEPVVGDAIVIQTPEGTSRVLWSAWDDAASIPLVIDADNTGFYPQGIDWTHGNYLEYNAARDSWLVSFRNLNSVIEFSNADGSWMRSFGEYGTYTLRDEQGTVLDWQIIGHPHNAMYTDDGTIVMLTMPTDANGNEQESLVLELVVDDANQTVDIVWRYGEGLGFFANVQGSGMRLDNGNTLINWGAAGVIQEVTPDKVVVWEGSFGIGNFAGLVRPLATFYPGL